MKLTEEQKQAIIKEASDRLSAIADDPLDGRDDLELDEDDYGRSYDKGSCSLAGEIEELCLGNGISGIDPANSEIYINLEYDGTAYYHDDYDPGDYWTPPSGGIELDDFELFATALYVGIDVLNEEADEYETIEVSEDEIKEMLDAINEIAGVSLRPRKSRKLA